MSPDLTEGQQLLLVQLRGGCRCLISAPCPACAAPVTNTERRLLTGLLEPAAPRTVKAPPQLPPEIWQTRPVDAELAMASVRDMSRGGA